MEKGKAYMTPEGWRRPTDHERHHRENGWNYRRPGVYHFTITVAERYPLFGRLEGETPEEARVRLNDFGLKVLERLLDTPRYYEERGYALKLLATQIMPDHIHFAIHVLAPIPQSIGQVVRGFKSACTALYRKEYEENSLNDERKMNGEGRDIPKHFSRIFTRTGSIWEQKPEHYHERILHEEGQLRRMIDYIKDNPRRLAIKRAHPEMFRIQTNLESCGMNFRALGNRFWLDYPIKEALHCSRTMSKEEIEAKREECFAKAENGTVFISAAISEGEKQICRALREAGYPLVVILAEGFPKEDSEHYRYYKPSGVYFEACAQGQLLLIEPSEEMFERPEIVERTKAKVGNIPHETKRWRFVAMNYMAEELSQICDKNDRLGIRSMMSER